jgi:hypothetical protein
MVRHAYCTRIKLYYIMYLVYVRQTETINGT